MGKNSSTAPGGSIIDRIDIQGTDWISAYGMDFIMVHNPKFFHEQRHPYQLDTSLAIYCEKGQAGGKLNLHDCTLTEGGFLIILPGNIVESFERSDDFEATYIFMSEAFLNNLEIADSFKYYRSISECPYITFGQEGKDAMALYIGMARKMLSLKENPNRYEVIKLLTKAFFLGMGYFIHPASRTEESFDARDAIVRKFLSLLKDNYLEHRDVEFYADKMNMTAKYMSTVVKLVSGKSASKWIDEYVVLHAKALLSSTTKSINEVCYEMGFSSLSFFGRYFKRVTGLSPREYRYQIFSKPIPGDEEGDI